MSPACHPHCDELGLHALGQMYMLEYALGRMVGHLQTIILQWTLLLECGGSSVGDHTDLLADMALELKDGSQQALLCRNMLR